MKRSGPFFSGVPVGPDVKLLLDRFGTPTPGTDIARDAVEKALGMKHTEHRYRTVVTRWMQVLWDDWNIRVIGVGHLAVFRCLTPEERLDQSEHQRVKGTRRLTQAVKEAVTTPTAELSDSQLTRHMHLVRSNVMALSAVKDIQREYGLALKKSPEPLPRRVVKVT